jgi:hypothetical protein
VQTMVSLVLCRRWQLIHVPLSSWRLLIVFQFNPYESAPTDPSMMGWYADHGSYPGNVNDYFPSPQQPTLHQPVSLDLTLRSLLADI